jgi:hypothetical protein
MTDLSHRAVRAPRTGRTVGPTRAPDIRAPAETPPYHGDIFAVITTSPASTYLRSLFFLVPSRPTIAAPPAMDATTAKH